ncbi:acetyl-CoA carboxylase biotin carboxyl carrier protein [Thermoflavimicrobium dichotomicum]|uniref:Acetyl-CoA carboxylase biotin carboxyl carrier protein n=2 Tax=Thermoflavimicrobium dichotomicum TaxID=46223 RepID=A0A1I3N7C3_9BACL|nr:acetyl-CoA carboxylase biotin carboxyl carrier protein [Thermoflavimicrobium dichotomicum]
MAKIQSSMTGTVWKVLVRPGDQVEAGQEVVILESMKMEIPIQSDYTGVVKDVKVEEGSFVSDGDVLVELAD